MKRTSEGFLKVTVAIGTPLQFNKFEKKLLEKLNP